MESRLLLEPASDNKVTELEKNKKLKQLLFREGLGVDTTRGVPIRSFSYVAPVLSVVKDLNSACERAAGQIYIADKGVIRNGIDPEIVEENSAMMENSIAAFIAEFFPEIESRIEIAREIDDSENTEREGLVSDMVTILAEFVEANPEDSLSKFISKRDPKSALRYTAEHALYMGDAITNNPDLFLVPQPNFDYKKLVMIGGRSEKTFKKAREIIETARMKVLGVENPQELLGYETDQLYMKAGSAKPPYFKLGNEPSVHSMPAGINSVGEFLMSLPPEIRRDYIYLLTSISDSPERFDVRESVGRKKWKAFEVPYPEELQFAYEKLRVFIANL